LAKKLGTGSRLALRDPEGVMLAVLRVDDVWRPDRGAEAAQVYGSTDPSHPGVAYVMDGSHPYYVGGELEGLQLPRHYDFVDFRSTPRSYASASHFWAGAASWLSRPATRRTARIRS
jgi:sulfate adenylyltransferase